MSTLAAAYEETSYRINNNTRVRCSNGVICMCVKYDLAFIFMFNISTMLSRVYYFVAICLFSDSLMVDFEKLFHVSIAIIHIGPKLFSHNIILN
jgi:hypothetical protein